MVLKDSALERARKRAAREREIANLTSQYARVAAHTAHVAAMLPRGLGHTKRAGDSLDDDADSRSRERARQETLSAPLSLSLSLPIFLLRPKTAIFPRAFSSRAAYRLTGGRPSLSLSLFRILRLWVLYTRSARESERCIDV